MGRSCFFLRLFGCPVKCEWCDSAGTWHPDYTPRSIEKLDASELAQLAEEADAEFVVITGGEPAAHDLRPLLDALKRRGLSSHLETSGALAVRGEVDWMTLSPKWAQLPLRENLDRADEFKIIVEDAGSIERWVAEIGMERLGRKPVWLHPEWSRRGSREVLVSISKWIKRHGAPFRAGYQLHKLYQADQLDPHSRRPAPLGGNPELGY